MDNPKQTVAIIGGGPAGLTVLKNFLEDGTFMPTLFESSPRLGGTWVFTAAAGDGDGDGDGAAPAKTTVLPSTIANFSKHLLTFTDFPFGDGVVGDYPSAGEVEEYLEAYVERFGLRGYCRVGVKVLGIERVEGKGGRGAGWRVRTRKTGGGADGVDGGVDEGDEEEVFDKVVNAVGPFSKAKIPEVEGIEKFRGLVRHSQGFKGPEPFKDMRVLVVGIRPSGADTASSLVGVAKKIFISHRRGTVFLPRYVNSLPLDHGFTRRGTLIPRMLGISGPLTRYALSQVETEVDPAWGFKPAPSFPVAIPTVTDTLVQHMRAGEVVPCTGIARVVSENTVELSDGTRIEVDAIIWCTGYNPDFSTTAQELSPSNHDGPASWVKLYKNLLSPQYPDSLAWIGQASPFVGYFCHCDLGGMMIAQTFSGKLRVPTKKEIEGDLAASRRLHETLTRKHGGVQYGLVKESWYEEIAELAGCGTERLGYGWAGWKWWLWPGGEKRHLAAVLMGGLTTPLVYRLFETGRRRAWAGAEAAILRANAAGGAANAAGNAEKD